VVDTVVSLLFGNKRLSLLKIAAELAGNRDLKWPTRHKMVNLLLWDKGLPLFVVVFSTVHCLRLRIADWFLWNN